MSQPTAPRPDPGKLAVEARARIIWGDPLEDVRRWMAEQGAPEALIERTLADAMAERAASMRAKGLRDIVVGGAAFAACGAMVGLVAWIMHKDVTLGGRGGRGPGVVLLAGVAGAIWGANRLLRGISRVTRGARAEGADSALDDES